MKLDAKAFGLSVGILTALGIFALGVFAMNGYAEPFVTLISSGYIGYDATLVGSLIGAVWGFFDGLIGGWILAALYNKLSK